MISLLLERFFERGDVVRHAFEIIFADGADFVVERIENLDLLDTQFLAIVSIARSEPAGSLKTTACLIARMAASASVQSFSDGSTPGLTCTTAATLTWRRSKR